MVDIVFDGRVSSGSLNVNASTVVDGVIDDDSMSTSSATKLSTSESIKSYTDTSVTDSLSTGASFLLGGM